MWPKKIARRPTEREIVIFFRVPETSEVFLSTKILPFYRDVDLIQQTRKVKSSAMTDKPCRLNLYRTTNPKITIVTAIKIVTLRSSDLIINASVFFSGN